LSYLEAITFCDGFFKESNIRLNLIDGFIVNIGLDFEVVCYSNYYKREVIANCLTEMQVYFNIDNYTKKCCNFIVFC
jgi:hypothetical protein